MLRVKIKQGKGIWNVKGESEILDGIAMEDFTKKMSGDFCE